MFYLYIIFIFISGYSLASLWQGKGNDKTLNLALTPLCGIFLPSLIMVVYNMINLRITSVSLWSAWLPIALLLIIFKRKSLKDLALSAADFYRSSNKWNKILIILVVLGFVQFFSYAITKAIWAGDGKNFWGPRAIFWAFKGELIFTKEYLACIPAVWAKAGNAYPFYHTLGMMVNILSLPNPPAYKVSLFDFFHFVGIFFTFLYVLKNLGWKKNFVFWGAFIGAFFQRELLMHVNNGYAVTDMAYYCFLGFFTLYFAHKKKCMRSFLIGGFVLALLTITKNEGLYRAIIMLTLLQLFVFRKLLNWKNYVAIIAPMIVVKLIHSYNHPVAAFNEYIDTINLSYDFVMMRLPHFLGAFFYALKPEAIQKCFWPLSIAVLIYYFLINCKKKDRLFEANPIYFRLIWVSLLVFLGNSLLTSLPALITDPLPGIAYTDFRATAVQGVGRLNLHVSSFISLSVLLAFQQMFLKKAK